MEVYVEKGKVIKKVSSENKRDTYEFNEDAMTFVKNYIDNMTDAEIQKVMDSLREIAQWVEKHDINPYWKYSGDEITERLRDRKMRMKRKKDSVLD